MIMGILLFMGTQFTLAGVIATTVLNQLALGGVPPEFRYAFGPMFFVAGLAMLLSGGTMFMRRRAAAGRHHRLGLARVLRGMRPHPAHS